jgi:hypothetical protein
MGIFFPFLLVMGFVLVACTFFGLPAFAAVMSVLACLMAGLSAGLAGILYLTNCRQINYETAFRLSFLTGVGVVAASLVAWTAMLDLSAGGLTTDLVANLWYVSSRLAFGSFAVALLTFGSWMALVFFGRKADPSNKKQ